MNYEQLPRSEKLALLNLAATLANLKLFKIPTEQFDEEEIVDFLEEKAEYLFSKSNLWKKP